MNEAIKERLPEKEAPPVVWRTLWTLLFVATLLLAALSELIPVYDYAWDDMTPERVDEDALTVVRLLLCFAYIPAIVSAALPVKSRTLRICSVVLGCVISVLLMRLPG
ncbi:hypothetical protein [Nonomuraea sp. NPDC049758]|uniref:hypothetical protein n=1 Tax=Nonomuraea sp. NPDC049758 TaxID=3154360 RepID=UPI003439DE87